MSETKEYESPLIREENKKMATIEMELREPRWPNYLSIKLSPRNRQEGFNLSEAAMVPVGSLNIDQVEWLIESLRRHCAAQRTEAQLEKGAFVVPKEATDAL